jgi:hypothetical protein
VYPKKRGEVAAADARHRHQFVCKGINQKQVDRAIVDQDVAKHATQRSTSMTALIYVLNSDPRPRLQCFLSKETKPAGGTGFLETAFAFRGSALGAAW